MNNRTSAGTGRVLLAILLLGAGLRLWQWGAGGSLWLDEIARTRVIRSEVEGSAPAAWDALRRWGIPRRLRGSE